MFQLFSYITYYTVFQSIKNAYSHMIMLSWLSFNFCSPADWSILCLKVWETCWNVPLIICKHLLMPKRNLLNYSWVNGSTRTKHSQVFWSIIQLGSSNSSKRLSTSPNGLHSQIQKNPSSLQQQRCPSQPITQHSSSGRNTTVTSSSFHNHWSGTC